MRTSFLHAYNLKSIIIYLVGIPMLLSDFVNVLSFICSLIPANMLVLSSPFKDSFLVFSFILFGFGIVQSFFTLSFFGLYGTFICQFITLLNLWIALCLNAERILFLGEHSHIIISKWFVLSSHSIVYWEFYLDIVSLSFALLTTSIALFVLVYTFAYFRYEPNVDRLILLLSSFVWSMVLLVLSGNMFLLLLGWELIGLTSFLLINFWATRAGTFKAAFKAFTFNKFSDAALIFAIILLGITFQDLTIQTILTESTIFNTNCILIPSKIRALELICFFLLIAASIKSAQFISHLWLPDSMEAPVPASALIHSATLVSAGVFLVLRLYPLFEQSWIFCNITPLIGAITAAYGGLVAAYQTDVKRLLAYSTISHCGFLMLLTTLGSIEHTLVYLYIHGFFKAMAFLCVGNVIRFSKNYQDLRRMGNFWKFLPIELVCLVIALLNLSGAPFFWGFVCKHLVLVAASKSSTYLLVWGFTLVGALMGPFYSYKLITHIFFDTIKSRKSVLLSNSRKSLSSYFNSNTPIAGWLSICFLGLVAYILIFLLVTWLVWTDNTFSDSLSLININQADQVSGIFLGSLLNISFFNWLGIIAWLSIIIIKWGYEYNSFKVLEQFLFYLLILFYLILALKII